MTNHERSTAHYKQGTPPSIGTHSLTTHNHTDEPSATRSVVLNGAPGKQVGLAKSLRVVPGDTVNIEVFAKYFDPPSTEGTGTFIADAITSAFGLSSTSIGYEFSAYQSLNSIFSSGWVLGVNDWEDANAPKAFLNYILFDEHFVPYDMGWDQIDISAAVTEQTPNPPHDSLSLQAVVTEPGYVYIYFSNEEQGDIVEVYFDDLRILHKHGPVIRADDYYPFGLTFNSYSRENSTPNQYLYNGKEKQEELGLDWYDHGARMYMPEIGRWGVIDPLAEKFLAWSPYNFVYNNPVNFSDPTGESGIASIDEKNKTITVSSHLVFYGSKASDEQAKKTTAEIQKMYDAAGGKVTIDGVEYSVKFNITSEVLSEDKATEMAEGNTSALNNFIRVEDSNIASRSFMELGGNGGHWLTTDKLGESTTAAHEKGHGYGLDHTEGDQRGKGQPDIMAARGTLVDSQYQWDPKAAPGAAGGTVNPSKRAVTQRNITDMFSGVKFKDGKANIGRATNTMYDKIGNPVIKKK